MRVLHMSGEAGVDGGLAFGNVEREDLVGLPALDPNPSHSMTTLLYSPSDFSPLKRPGFESL